MDNEATLSFGRAGTLAAAERTAAGARIEAAFLWYLAGAALMVGLAFVVGMGPWIIPVVIVALPVIVARKEPGWMRRRPRTPLALTTLGSALVLASLGWFAHRDVPLAWLVPLGAFVVWAAGRTLRASILTVEPRLPATGPWACLLAGAWTGPTLWDATNHMHLPFAWEWSAAPAYLALTVLLLRASPQPRAIAARAVGRGAARAWWTGFAIGLPVIVYVTASMVLASKTHTHLNDGRVGGGCAAGFALGLLRAVCRSDASDSARSIARGLVLAASMLVAVTLLLPLVPGGDVNRWLHERGLPKSMQFWRDVPLALVLFAPAGYFLGLANARLPRIARPEAALFGWSVAQALSLCLTVVASMTGFTRGSAAWRIPWVVAALMIAAAACVAFARPARADRKPSTSSEDSTHGT